MKVPFDGITMMNTKGRDNSMYYVSDGFNLQADDEDDQPLNSLMTLNNVKSTTSQLSYQKPNVGIMSSRDVPSNFDRQFQAKSTMTAA